MEHYESLSGDRSDERNREYYQTIRSFDLTQDSALPGAVRDEGTAVRDRVPGLGHHA
jgi:DEAD/DEAH box helicase domain-containing protein